LSTFKIRLYHGLRILFIIINIINLIFNIFISKHERYLHVQRPNEKILLNIKMAT